MNGIDNIKTAIDAGRELALKINAGANKRDIPYAIVKKADGSEDIRLFAEFVDAKDEHGNVIGREIVSYTYPSPPHGIVRNAALGDARSFCDYVAEFVNDHTKIYADLKKQTFTAVFDDHKGGDGKSSADWRDHRATFKAEHSMEWQLWNARNGRNNGFDGNTELAEFLEDAYFDVVSPPGADMLLIAQTFKINEDVNFKSAVPSANGTIGFTYEKVVSSSAGVAGELSVPEKIVLEIPVYSGLNPRKYQVSARFRHRLGSGGKLALWLELERPTKVIEQAFADIVKDISVVTGDRPIYVGDAG
jgi:hypothetical protein